MSTPAHLITIGLERDLNSDIRHWFNTFNFLPPLNLSAAQIDTVAGPASLEHLLELMAASQHKNFILIAHGHEDGSGLYLRLAHSRGKPIGSQKTEHTHLQRLMDLDEPGIQPGDLEKKRLGINDHEIRQILDLMNKVRQKKINCIEFRACNLGRDPLSLERFRKFFGARVAGAPDLHTFFGRGPVLFGEEHMKTHKRRHGGGNWETYSFPNALTDPDLECCFRVNGENKPSGGHITAEDGTVFQAWLRKWVVKGGSHNGGEMPLHGLWVTGRQILLEPEDVNSPLGGPGAKRVVLPLSENYRKHVIYSK